MLCGQKVHTMLNKTGLALGWKPLGKQNPAAIFAGIFLAVMEIHDSSSAEWYHGPLLQQNLFTRYGVVVLYARFL